MAARSGLVAARGGGRSDALGGIRPRHYAHRGRARRGWPGRADPRLRAGLAAPAAAFALALPALGATFIGAALATRASGLTRPWQRLLGVAGGSLLILAGAGNLAIADGSPLLFVGLLGFAAWLVWLVVMPTAAHPWTGLTLYGGAR